MKKKKRQRPIREFNIATLRQFRTLAMFFWLDNYTIKRYDMIYNMIWCYMKQYSYTKFPSSFVVWPRKGFLYNCSIFSYARTLNFATRACTELKSFALLSFIPLLSCLWKICYDHNKNPNSQPSNQLMDVNCHCSWT